MIIEQTLINNNNNNLQQTVNEKISEFSNNISTTEQVIQSNLQDTVNRLNNRIDNIIPCSTSTEGNTELIDIRTGADGTVYASAGTAVRNQINTLENTVSDLSFSRINVFNYKNIRGIHRMCG